MPHQVLRALGAIYGTKDAGRAWYLHLKKHLLPLGWYASQLERCLFFLRNERGSLVAVLFVHVDDLLVAFKADSGFERQLPVLQKLFHLERRDERIWEYCGKQIVVSESAFTVGCPKFGPRGHSHGRGSG